jgi:hypothetical protein
MKKVCIALVSIILLASLLMTPAPASAEDKVTICHKPGTPAQKTMDVPADAVDGHLGHGDTLGSCTDQPPPESPSPDNGVEKVTICHKPGTPAQKTMDVPADAVDGHLGHGDYLGPCTDEPPPAAEDNEAKVTICHKPGTPAQKTMDVPADAVDGHLGHGDYLGSCTDEPPPDGVDTVTICHKPDTPAEKTMTLPVEALAGHLGHGDYLGPCLADLSAASTIGPVAASRLLPHAMRQPVPV